MASGNGRGSRLTNVDSTLIRRMQLGAACAGVFVAAIASLAMIGWAFHIPTFIRFAPGMTAIKFNSALAFWMCGVALWIRARFQNDLRADRIAMAMGALAALIGLICLLEHLLGVDLRFNELF